MKLPNSAGPMKRSVRNSGFAIGALHIALLLQLAFSTAYQQIFGGSILALLILALLALTDALIFINGARGRYVPSSKAVPVICVGSCSIAFVTAFRLFVPQQPNPLHFTVWYVPLLLIFLSDLWSAPLFLQHIPRPNERNRES